MPAIVDYDEQYLNDFKQLNLEWLDKFNLTESPDLEILNYPQENAIDKGGFIFLLKENDTVIGTAGIIKMNHCE